MADLNKLLKDFYDNRLAYKEQYRQKFEALLTAMVDDIEALKDTTAGMRAVQKDFSTAAEAAQALKRGPGRPPKEAADG